MEMDATAAKLIGAGLAAIGAGIAAIGVGNVFGSFLESALRNPALPTASRAACSSASRPPNFWVCCRSSWR
jgi:F0F1-type ATP synthase membrane subunit c/vacuolar-type H+-ATPase subunit K